MPKAIQSSKTQGRADMATDDLLTSGAVTASRRALRAALSRRAYWEGKVRLVDGDLSGCDCLVASREGLFGVGASGVVKIIAHGFFFGIRRHRNHIIAFEAGDRPASPSGMGRIVRFTLTDRRMHDATVIATGLDNGCHLLAVLADHLCVVDTAHQSIWRLTLNGEPMDKDTFGSLRLT